MYLDKQKSERLACLKWESLLISISDIYDQKIKLYFKENNLLSGKKNPPCLSYIGFLIYE